jgi:hypothetical protein
MYLSVYQSIQALLRDYRRGCILRALKHFRQSAFTLLCSRLGLMALQATHEFDGVGLTKDERRHLVTAQLFTMIHVAGIEAEDWIVKALVELAMRESELPAPASAIECFYL